MKLRVRHFWWRSTAIAVASVLLVGVGLAPLAPAQPAAAVDGSGFDPGFIISDELFFNSSTMDEQQVQAFLEAKMPGCTAPAGNPGCLRPGNSTGTRIPRRASTTSRAETTPFNGTQMAHAAGPQRSSSGTKPRRRCTTTRHTAQMTRLWRTCMEPAIAARHTGIGTSTASTQTGSGLRSSPSP